MSERDELIRQAYIKMANDKIDRDAPIVQEQHPDVGFLDRLLIKNTDMDPYQAKKYLQKKYPTLQVEDREGQLLLKNKGEGSWKVLDPKGLDLQDVSDLGGTVAEGIAQTAGGALGAIGGIMSSGGALALPGFMAGSAAGGGAANLAKQAAKKYLGAQDEIDYKEAGINAAISGALSPLFGGGSSVATSSMKKGFTKNVIEKGLVKMGYNKATRNIAPKIAGFLSGGKATPEEFKFATSHPDILKEIDADPLKPIEELKGYLRTRVELPKELLKKDFEALSMSNAPIDITGSMSKLRNVVIDLKKAVDANPGNKAFQRKFQDAWKLYDEIALEGDGAVRQEIGKTTVSTAMRLKDILGELADSTEGGKFAIGNKNGAINSAANNAKAKINSALDKVDGGIRKEYKKLSDNERNIQSLFDSKVSTQEAAKGENLLNRLGKNKSFTEEVKKVTGPLEFNYHGEKITLPAANIEEAALAQKAYHNLYSPSYSPNFTNRTLGNLGMRAIIGGALGSPWGTSGMLIGSGVGMYGTSPGMLKQYLKLGKGVEKLANPALKYSGTEKILRGESTRKLKDYFNNGR